MSLGGRLTPRPRPLVCVTARCGGCGRDIRGLPARCPSPLRGRGPGTRLLGVGKLWGAGPGHRPHGALPCLSAGDGDPPGAPELPGAAPAAAPAAGPLGRAHGLGRRPAPRRGLQVRATPRIPREGVREENHRERDQRLREGAETTKEDRDQGERDAGGQGSSKRYKRIRAGKGLEGLKRSQSRTGFVPRTPTVGCLGRVRPCAGRRQARASDSSLCLGNSEAGEQRPRPAQSNRGRARRPGHSPDGAVTGPRVRPRGGQGVAGGGPGHAVTASLRLPAASAPRAEPGRPGPAPHRGGAWPWQTTRPSASARGCWPPWSAAAG